MFNHFVLCAICGFIGLSLSAAGIKQLLLTHDFWSIIFPLLLNSAMMMGIALYLLQGKQGFNISKWMIHIFRGMLGFTGIVCGIYGLKYLNLGLFQTLVNLYPVITLILAALILKEAIGWKVWLAVGLSMGGIVIAFDPKLDGGIMFLFPLAVDSLPYHFSRFCIILFSDVSISAGLSSPISTGSSSTSSVHSSAFSL